MADPLSISSDDKCWDPLWSLGREDVGPLADYLAQETGTLHPLVQRELAKLLRGDHKSHKLTLTPVAKPGRPRKKGIYKGSKISCTGREVSSFIENHGGSLTRARKAARDKFGISSTTLRRIEKDRERDRQRLMRFLRAHTSR